MRNQRRRWPDSQDGPNDRREREDSSKSSEQLRSVLDPGDLSDDGEYRDKDTGGSNTSEGSTENEDLGAERRATDLERRTKRVSRFPARPMFEMNSETRYTYDTTDLEKDRKIAIAYT